MIIGSIGASNSIVIGLQKQRSTDSTRRDQLRAAQSRDRIEERWPGLVDGSRDRADGERRVRNADDVCDRPNTFAEPSCGRSNDFIETRYIVLAGRHGMAGKLGCE